MIRRGVTLVVVVLLFAGAGVAQDTSVLYVRASGDDDADGLSPATALRSIRTAARLFGEADEGGTVIVGPGTYPEGDISLRPLTSLTSERVDPVEFIADRDGSRTGDPPGPVLVDATDWETGFLIYGEASVTIDGFYVRNGSDAGIQVRYNRGAATPSESITIANCVVFSNAKRGIDVQDADSVLLLNNLTYANGSTGISVGGNITGTSDAVVALNTSSGNGVYGIFVGAAGDTPVESGKALVLSNVVAGNGVAGIKVAPSSQRTYGSAFNVNADRFEPATTMDPTDLNADPLLANPAGPDGILGGTGFADDDFRLRPGSPAIDYGPADVTTLGITGGTRDDGSADAGTVDAGRHVGNATAHIVVPPIPLAPIFVRTTGSDGNDGTTPARALATIRRAATLARAGHRVVVGAGAYHEGDLNLQDRSGTPYRPVEFFADLDGVLTGDAGPVVINAAGTGYQTGFDILGSSYVTIDGFFVTGGADAGIQIRARPTSTGWRAADHATVSNSIVFSNTGGGIVARDAAEATIYNNLVYANGTGGVAVGGDVLGSPKTRVIHNTVYRNGGHGVLIGNRVLGEHVGSTGALVMNNIFDQNGGRPLLITPLSLKDYVGAANLDGAVVGSLDFVDPAGPDHLLGGAGFADDNFRLQQRVAGQSLTSVAVDRSIIEAALIGVDQGSTRTDIVPDQGLADVGFHYGRGHNVRPTLGFVQSIGSRTEGSSISRLLFVSPGGDDGNDGRSPASAWRSLRAAARAAIPGDTVIVAPGRYAEGDIHLNNSGTVLQPIQFVADTSGRASGAAPGAVIIDTGGQFDTGFVLLKRRFVQIRGFHITGARQAGIQVRACPGAAPCPPGSGSDHVTIAQNVIFSGRRGIDVIDSSDATIVNNLIYANRSTGIDISGESFPAANAQVINNTLYRNGGDAVLLGGAAAAPTAELIDNLIQGNRFLGVRTKAGSQRGLVLDHNINRDGANSYTPRDAHDPGVDPAFVAPAGADGVLGGAGFADDNFRLDATSPAVDAGGLAAADVALSAGVARSDGQPDSGPADLGYHYEVPGPLAGTATPAVTLYVRAVAGNDANDGHSPDAAWRTIGRAGAQAGAGTTIVIGPGTYREGNLRPLANGTLTNPIVFTGDADGVLTGDAPGPVLIDAGGASTALLLAAKANVRLSGLAITGARLAGILTQGASHVEIADCRLFSNAGAGLMVVRPRGGNTVFNNLVYANGGDGVQVRLRQVHDSAVRLVNNTVYGNHGRGMWIDRSRTQRRLGTVLLAHNILQANAGDLAVTPSGWPTLHVLPNALSQPSSGISDATGLLVVPPVFGAPAGSDGILGGAGFADDDFRVAAGSSVIDAGSGTAADWGLDHGSLRTDHVTDSGQADLGYHYQR